MPKIMLPFSFTKGEACLAAKTSVRLRQRILPLPRRRDEATGEADAPHLSA